MKVAGRDTLPIRIGRADAPLLAGKPTVSGETGEIEDEPDEFTDEAQDEVAAESYTTIAHPTPPPVRANPLPGGFRLPLG